MYITINYTLKYANIEKLKAVTITATKIKNKHIFHPLMGFR